MANLCEIWKALRQYQPYAEKHGFGAEWKRMTTKRTPEAAYDAWLAAGDAADNVDAMKAAYKAMLSAEHSSDAIDCINDAIERENTAEAERDELPDGKR